MVEFVAQEFIKLKRTLTPSEFAGSALSKNRTYEKNNNNRIEKNITIRFNRAVATETAYI